MSIQDLFVKPVDRHIEGVIKADDDRHLKTEVEEYVITKDVEKGLNEFVERYLEEDATNGVWISGFFGSGKSHLLKMLSLVLDDKPLPSGESAADIFLPKVEDAILQGELKRASRIPSRSILFNIDQKSDAIGGDSGSPILEVFIKVLNELQGYYAKQGHIARFEYDLDSRGELEAFRAAYQAHSGRNWEHDLPVIETLENETFAEVYSTHFGKSYEEGLKLFDRLRENYRVSIEDFGDRVKSYIDSQAPNFRLNFFVDEVGQFIGEDTKRMLNLQTVAETLATKCNGRAWVIVTSQGDLRSVLGQLKKNEGDDFTKIQGRFKTRLTLTGADVREVIQKRLLAKHEAEPEVLTSIYDAEKENLRTLYRFADGSVEFKGWRGSDEFCAYYPFHTYQFDLFQRAIEQLSRHDAFTGRHTSVGERSMLAVFQEVAMAISGCEIGQLATFDLMFEGVAASLRGDIQTSVKQAQRQLDDPVAVRIIKALFLLKWVREFRATPRNIAILLIDNSNIDIQQHEKSVREALKLLESQSYLQRNGECYEFLTDVEKDIDVEIKGTDIDDTQMSKLLSDILFSDLLRDPKIRYEGNGQDYSYARKLDDHLVGRDAELVVNIITTDHPNHGQLMTLAAQNTGKAELLTVLPDDLRLASDARLFLKTQKYVQQNTGGSLDEGRRSILTERGRQNSERRKALQELCSGLMSKAPIYLNGSELTDIGQGDPRNRFAKANQSLISFAYPNLRMLKGKYDEGTLSNTLLGADDLFSAGGQTLSEAEQEVLTYVMRNQSSGDRTSVEEIIRNFGRRPYGWYPMAILTLIARLFRMGKVELRAGDLLDAKSALTAMKNSRQHGSIRVRMQEQFDPSKVNALKRFYQDFFDRVNAGTDPRSIAQLTCEALTGEARDLEMLTDQARIYPFLTQLTPFAVRIKEIGEKDYSYLLNHLADFSDELLDAKDDYLAPIKAFMHGPQRAAYDEVLSFLKEEEANFSEIDESDLEPLRALERSQAPYRGPVLPTAKAAVTSIKELIQTRLDEERDAANMTLDQREAQLRGVPDFQKLDEGQQAQVLAKSNEARASIASARFVSAIRDRLSRYTSQEYPAQLALAARLAAPPAEPVPPTDTDTPPPPPKQEPKFVPVGKLIEGTCSLPYISNEAELDEWLENMRAKVAEELSKGNRVSL